MVLVCIPRIVQTANEWGLREGAMGSERGGTDSGKRNQKGIARPA